MNKTLGYLEFPNDGPKAVFLHGFFEDARMWQDLLPDLPFHSLAIDLPAYKSSEDFDFINMDQVAELVHQLLVKKGWKKYYLFGHSMGGYVGLSYLKLYAEELIGLGMIHSHPFADSDEKKAQRDKMVSFTEKFGLGMYAKQFFPKLFAKEYNDNFWIHTLSLRATQLSNKAIRQSLIAMRDREDQMELLKSTDTPILQIIGVQDSLVDVDSTIEAGNLPEKSMLEIYPNVGHMSMFEIPKTLDKSLRKFTQFCARLA